MSIERKITPETLRRLIEYDPNTGYLFWLEKPGDQKFNKRWAGRRALNCPSGQYQHLRGSVLGCVAMAHRVAWAIYYGEWPSGVIDHIDGNPQNNKISNLRACSHQQNCMNRNKKTGETSKYHGVYYCKRDKRYYATARHNYKVSNLGCFVSEEEAARARDAFVKRARGAFAVLNFPENGNG